MPNAQPNVLILLSDQLRRQAMSCYGDPNLSTPNVDRLAEQGTLFRGAWATYPICVPFRFTMMTGRPAHSRAVPSINWRMSPTERTLADEFDEAGYETIYIGKWHLWGQALAQDPVPPEHRGRWEQWLGYEHPKVGGERFDHQRTLFWHDGAEPTVLEEYETDGLYGLAMDYLENQRDRSRPFACIVSVRPPHPPMNPPPDLAAQWADREVELPASVRFESADPRRPFDESTIREEWRMYYGMVQSLDANVGQMMDFLDRTGLAEETVVVFLSDHGELGGAHGLRRKSFPYEESVGIPLIVRHPRAPGGRVIEDPVCTEDLFPTFLGLAGVEPPVDLPGTNLSPLVRGERGRIDRPGVLLEFVGELRHNHWFYRQQWRAFRSRRYKYSVLGSGDRAASWQFFDLQEDPLETENRLGDPCYESEAHRHHEWLGRALAETGDHCRLRPFDPDARPEPYRGEQP